MTSTFTASFSLPDGLTPPTQDVASRGASLTDNPLFEVSKVEVNGQSVTGTFQGVATVGAGRHGQPAG